MHGISRNDVFAVRLEVTLTNGRVFSSNNAGGIITGGFFESHFEYRVKVSCIPASPLPGN